MQKFLSDLNSKVIAFFSAIFFFLTSTLAHADLVTDAEAAITSAKDDALTVGGYVVLAFAALLVVGLILKMMNKI